MPAEPVAASNGPSPTAPQPFVMLGDSGALCVDGVCAVPTGPPGASAPAGATHLTDRRSV
ncbi:hypothetical protein [Sanguibacter sp. 25GB23B1]|uniref:hypothetical protein n=1 Tax=unclassified Sanguibacter TaxID=2645534 RepID=UPI0032AEE610